MEEPLPGDCAEIEDSIPAGDGVNGHHDPEGTSLRNSSAEYATVIHTFDGYGDAAQQASQLRVVSGDSVVVLSRHESGWTYGRRAKDGKEGWFPNGIIP
jgi:hypothetical protein